MPRIDDFFAPTFERLPAELRGAIADSPLPSLTAGPQADALATLLRNNALMQVADSNGSGGPLPALAMSAMWLLAGDLDRSHTISQDDASAEGSCWHGIMHRREGDYSNAAYWFRRVGPHAVLDELARKYASSYGDPYQFIDTVAGAVKTRNVEEIVHLQQIQWTEWQLLVQDCMAE